MTRYLTATLVIVVVTGLTACTSTDQKSGMEAGSQEVATTVETDKEVHRVIAQNYKEFSQALEDGNVARIANEFYTEDARLVHRNGQIDSGRTQIEAAFGEIAKNQLDLKPEPVHVENYGKAAYEWGRFTLFNKEGKQVDQGNYVVIWKKENGSWKMWRDIVLSNPENPSEK